MRGASRPSKRVTELGGFLYARIGLTGAADHEVRPLSFPPGARGRVFLMATTRDALSNELHRLSNFVECKGGAA
jgi:hypothetical protein